MSRVSVLVNNHNYGRYLGAALQSVLDQDFPMDQVEIVAVDDASTDDSREVLSRFSPRVRSVFLPINHGQAGAFNAGFGAATGDILCLLDSDDWWDKTKLRRVVDRFDREPDLGVVQHWCQEIGPSGEPLPARNPPLPPRFTAEDFLRGGCVFTGTTGLSFRARVLKMILPVPADLRICADGYLYCSILNAPFGNIPEVLAWRRIHEGNRYAGRWRDPVKLRAHRAALSALDRELSRLLAAGGLTLSKEIQRRMRAEELLEDLFLARYAAGNWSAAVRSWKECVLLHKGSARLWKAATLLAALVSPDLYLDLQAVYARLRVILLRGGDALERARFFARKNS